MLKTADLALSFAASSLRLVNGARRANPGARPAEPLTLYEFENCPYCRKVREALSALEISVKIYPCPPGGSNFIAAAKERGGKNQFPLLVDPNHEVVMYESDQIIAHLFQHYGDGAIPLALNAGPLTDISSGLATMTRLFAPGYPRAQKQPEKLLELYGFEPCPYCRRVREALCEMELPYLLHNLPYDSPQHEALKAKAGKDQVPCLYDPNTEQVILESLDIIDYLKAHYA